MKELIDWFQQVLDVSIRLYFRQECEVTSLFEVQPPVNSWWREITGKPSSQITFACFDASLLSSGFGHFLCEQ